MVPAWAVSGCGDSITSKCTFGMSVKPRPGSLAAPPLNAIRAPASTCCPFWVSNSRTWPYGTAMGSPLSSRSVSEITTAAYPCGAPGIVQLVIAYAVPEVTAYSRVPLSRAGPRRYRRAGGVEVEDHPSKRAQHGAGRESGEPCDPHHLSLLAWRGCQCDQRAPAIRPLPRVRSLWSRTHRLVESRPALSLLRLQADSAKRSSSYQRHSCVTRIR